MDEQEIRRIEENWCEEFARQIRRNITTKVTPLAGGRMKVLIGLVDPDDIQFDIPMAEFVTDRCEELFLMREVVRTLMRWKDGAL